MCYLFEYMASVEQAKLKLLKSFSIWNFFGQHVSPTLAQTQLNMYIWGEKEEEEEKAAKMEESDFCIFGFWPLDTIQLYNWNPQLDPKRCQLLKFVRVQGKNRILSFWAKLHLNIGSRTFDVLLKKLQISLHLTILWKLLIMIEHPDVIFWSERNS